MLGEVKRFHRQAKELLAGDDDAETLSEFLRRGEFSQYFVSHFVTPLISAVWSCAPNQAGEYPARYLFVFLSNHGALSVSGSPSLADRRRRVGPLRRAGRQGPDRGPDRRRRSGRSRRVGRRRRDPRRRRHGRDLRRRRDRDPSRTRRCALLAEPTAAEREILGRDRLHEQPDAAAHRHVGAAAPGAGPGVVELPPAGLRRRRRRGSTSATTSTGCSASTPTCPTSSPSTARTPSIPTR